MGKLLQTVAAGVLLALFAACSPAPVPEDSCACVSTMPGCTCDHCKELKAGQKPTTACPCKAEGDEGGG